MAGPGRNRSLTALLTAGWMDVPMTELLTVNLGERSYPLHFGKDLTADVRSALQSYQNQGRKLAVITDRRLLECQGGAMKTMFGDLPTLAVEPGENSKSLSVYGQALDFLADQRVDRSGVVLAVGGGVIGDLAGFAAASYLRGIDFVQVPTTLLAMVDSSVGGKTGINLKAGKNLVGAFHQPKRVFIATDLLSTLPPREFAAGMAEVIKYGLLGDPALFTRLEREPLTVKSADLAAVIRACCAMKARIVESDERELAKEGGRALLNLGHTFGHAVEQVTKYTEYLHGEAVAVGMAAAAKLSLKLGLIDSSAVGRIEAVLRAHALPVRLRAPLSLEQLMAALARDKKVRAGMPRFVVLKSLGEAATQSGVPVEHVEASFREIGAS
jgi:3-dehydroquinate synthase